MEKANKDSAEETTKTILVLTIGFALVAIISKLSAFLGVSIGLGLIGLLFPKLALFIHVFWMGLSKILGYIVPNIILGIVYFVILTPIGWLSRNITSKIRKLRKESDSNFLTVDKKYTPSMLENMW